jgi:hypothetical protein
MKLLIYFILCYAKLANSKLQSVVSNCHAYFKHSLKLALDKIKLSFHMLQSKQAPSKDKMGFQKESTFTKFAFSKQLNN